LLHPPTRTAAHQQHPDSWKNQHPGTARLGNACRLENPTRIRLHQHFTARIAKAPVGEAGVGRVTMSVMIKNPMPNCEDIMLWSDSSCSRRLGYGQPAAN
jgi:hypothetical protein